MMSLGYRTWMNAKPSVHVNLKITEKIRNAMSQHAFLGYEICLINYVNNTPSIANAQKNKRQGHCNNLICKFFTDKPHF